jgi:transcriptional regulator with XRE-family HTH domain
MGRKKNNVGFLVVESFDGPQWSRGYKHEWARVVGDRVRRLRTARGWTLVDLGRKVRKPEGGDYSGGYFSRLENGWSSPALYVYLATAAVLEVPPGKLLGRGELERELTPSQEVLLGFVERMGLTPEEAVIRLACGEAPPVG